jgi:hypothetical protein
MDPTANLEEQRRLAKRILACGEEEHPRVSCRCRVQAERLAELVEALDGWLVGGGFLPSRWAWAKK